MIYPSRYYFSQKDIDDILSSFRGILEKREFLTMGRYCENFEKDFAKYIGVKEAISCNNGTAAIEMILRSLDVRGKEVIVPTNTFAATVFAVLAAGAKPVFCDILQDLTIDSEKAKEKITPLTRAIITVHIGGIVSPKTEELVEICKEENIYFVEDAAHAHGSALNGKRAGSFGKASAFSFFSTKVITTGEGGMITTNDSELAQKMRILRNQAKESDNPLYPNYHKTVGNNFRLTEFQAIMGQKQLKMLDEFIKKRQELASVFQKELEGVLGLKCLPVPDNVRHNYYKVIVFLDESIPREEFIQRMREEFNIPLSGCCYELPCHKQPVFREYVQGEFPIADDLCARHIALPIYYEMTFQEAQEVARAVKSLAKTYAKN